MNKVEFDEKCKSCGGTGIYVGIAEMDGAGIVCSTCKGTGCHHVVFEYEDFEGKIEREDIEQVYAHNPGIITGKGHNKYKLNDFGGIPYKDWINGKKHEKGTENRKFTCPRWWFQCVDYKKIPNWNRCNESLGGTFSQCPYFVDKNLCWGQHDIEFN